MKNEIKLMIKIKKIINKKKRRIYKISDLIDDIKIIDLEKIKENKNNKNKKEEDVNNQKK